MEVTLLHLADCPHWRTAADRLERLGVPFRRVEVAGLDDARAAGMRGSPTILRDGRDAFPGDVAEHVLSCRLYATPDGLRGAPSVEQLRRVLA